MPRPVTRLGEQVFVVVVVAATIAGASWVISQGPESFSWYAARSAGFVAYALLSLSVFLGVMTSLRWPVPGLRRPDTRALHGSVSVLAFGFLGIHVAALLADAYVPFAPGTILGVAFSEYRPLAVLAGSVAMWLAVAATVVVAWKSVLGGRRWRWLHRVGYIAWVLALVHGITAGTDAGVAAAVVLYAVTGTAMAAALAYRVLSAQRVAAKPRPAMARVAVTNREEFAAAAPFGRPRRIVKPS